MTFRRIPLFAFSVLALAALLPLTGCRHEASENCLLAVPKEGMVRLIAGTPPASTPDHAQMTWSLLGGRNWTKPAARDTTLTLADSYALNDVNRQHGCNTWNCDLTLDRDRARPDQATWSLTLHGSNGMTARTTGMLPLPNGDLPGTITAMQEGTDSSRLPATFRLARLGGKEVTVSVSE